MRTGDLMVTAGLPWAWPRLARALARAPSVERDARRSGQIAQKHQALEVLGRSPAKCGFAEGRFVAGWTDATGRALRIRVAAPSCGYDALPPHQRCLLWRPAGATSIRKTPGGWLWWRTWYGPAPRLRRPCACVLLSPRYVDADASRYLRSVQLPLALLVGVTRPAAWMASWRLRR